MGRPPGLRSAAAPPPPAAQRSPRRPPPASTCRRCPLRKRQGRSQPAETAADDNRCGRYRPPPAPRGAAPGRLGAGEPVPGAGERGGRWPGLALPPSAPVKAGARGRARGGGARSSPSRAVERSAGRSRDAQAGRVRRAAPCW